MNLSGRIIYPILLSLLGAAFCYFIIPVEQERVAEHLIGFPDENETAHSLRPILLAILFFLPAIAALFTALAGTIDRYLIREFLRCFLICFSAFFAMLVLMELQNRASEFKDLPIAEVLLFYLIQAPNMLTMIIPFSLMLSLMWCLGKFSKSQEIVSIIQSGRSLFRIMLPFLITGVLMTTAMAIFSYHWAPYAEGYKRSMLREIQGEPNTVATGVGYGNPELNRVWTVGRFPKLFSQGKPLENVTITQTNDEGEITERYIAKFALWEKTSRSWILEDVIHIDYTPAYKEQNTQDITQSQPQATRKESVTLAYSETPWQIIRPGLAPNQLGVPELTSWIKNNPDHPLSFKRAYITWWHFRLAQPLICVIIVMLATPLGISFSRRNAGGGIAIAVFLSTIMLFCSEVFPTLGESGHLPPALAAWATNIIFFTIAIILFQRRIAGKPIHQSLKKLFPGN